jgi:hypothetical protein
MKEVGLFYGHLVYFKAFWCVLLTFGIHSGYLVYFSRFGMF